MSIKSISKLEAYDNQIKATALTTVGGNLRLFADNGEHSDKDAACSKPTDHNSFYTKTIEANNNNYFNGLFEISKPYDAGVDGKDSSEFESYKITYKDLADNIILDVKNYLNVRNNLGEFNLCALAFADYSYSGHKQFLPGCQLIGNASGAGQGVDIIANKYEDFALSVYGKTNIVGKNVNISSDYTSITGQVDIHGNTSITGNFKIENVLTANTTSVTIAPSVYFNNNISGQSAYFKNQITCSYLTATNGNITNLTATQISCSTITCAGIADLTAEHAKWSDLAEYYLADDKYEPGTLVCFGGENEVTIAKKEVNAVVTTKPAFLMNAGLKINEKGCAIAFVGRVPVKVVGKVKKFDKIVLSKIPGIARAKRWHDFRKNVIGRALETNDDIQNIKKIECIVKIAL